MMLSKADVPAATRFYTQTGIYSRFDAISRFPS